MNRIAACLLLTLSTGILVAQKAGRFDDEIAAFEKQDELYGFQRDFILFTGSSTIRLWENLKKDLREYTVLNRGFGGATLKDLNQYWNRIASKHLPSLVVVYCGENDLAEGANVEQTVIEFKNFLARYLQRYPHTPLIYIAMKPSPARMELWELYQETDRKIASTLENYPSLHFVDFSSSMFEKDKLRSEIFTSDSLHMNKKATKYGRKALSLI
ncbi:MAG: GDSL-type esterase/lipase family protein [Bacteroidota bacterium]